MKFLPGMLKQQIKQLIETRLPQDGFIETGVPAVKLFRTTEPVPCAPTLYEPCVIAIVSGAKEAMLNGARFVYDSERYLCCPLVLPVEAGTPFASPETPLMGVYISLDPRAIAELSLQMDAAGWLAGAVGDPQPAQGIQLCGWDDRFSEALFRLLQLGENAIDTATLGEGRLREVYYAILNGAAGGFARQTIGSGNAIARSIGHVAAHLDAPISIVEMAQRAGMSRAVFHRKFKETTTMSPIQFVKAMRLNHAAIRIAGGMSVSEAALDVGYQSSSQFSREFKRLYGQSPREWGAPQLRPPAMA